LAALAPRYIVDNSAQARLAHPAVAAVLAPLIRRRRIVTCGVVEFEVLFSARDYADFVRTRASRVRAFPTVPIEQADFDRAIGVMELLARRGYHRAVKLPDLLIAAVAERGGLTVLHYDADYDLIAGATGQTTQWVVPRGTVP
jgi:predicted nucleic acid-binding protein